MLDMSVLQPRAQSRVLSLLPQARSLAAKSTLYEAGQSGAVWRLAEGVICLERPGPDGLQFAGLALAGDLLGADILTSGRYAHTARALTPCEVRPWSAGQTQLDQRAVLASFVRMQQRTADLMALRTGSADARVMRLIVLLAGQAQDQIVLPTLKAMGEITDLATESVCRTMSKFRQMGALLPTVNRHRFVLHRSAWPAVSH